MLGILLVKTGKVVHARQINVVFNDFVQPGAGFFEDGLEIVNTCLGLLADGTANGGTGGRGRDLAGDEDQRRGGGDGFCLRLWYGVRG